MNPTETNSSYVPYLKATALATSLTIIPLVITIILGIGASYGYLGSSAQSLINLKILPFLHGTTGFASHAHLTIAIGSALTTLGFYVIFSFALTRFKKQPAEQKEISFSRTVMFSKKNQTSTNNQVAQNSSPVAFSTAIPEIQTTVSHELPQYVFAENGSLSEKHLQLYLLRSKKLSEEERREIILWSTSQRKFLSSATQSDANNGPTYGHGTIGFLSGSDPLFPNRAEQELITNLNGYALSTIKPDYHLKCFISPEKILDRKQCTTYEEPLGKISKLTEIEAYKRKGYLILGKYSDGKCILQQIGLNSSVLTCATMLKFDRGSDFGVETFLMYSYKLVSYNEISTERIKIQNVNQLAQEIKTHGPILAEVIDPQIGNHTFIVDSVDIGYFERSTTVTIRDPFHGWRITINALTLKGMKPKFKRLI